MNARFRTIACFVFALFLSVVFAPLQAQDTKPKKKNPTTEVEPAPENPAVAAILTTNPTTPAECVRSAKTLVDLGSPEAAKPLVKEVIDAKLDSRQLADLGMQFGVPAFLDLANQTVLQPESKELADAVEAAVTARLEDTKQIEGLIAQLQDNSEEKRLEALKGLQAAPRMAIGPLLSVLSDPARSNEYKNIRTVLAGMGRSARNALVAVLDSAADPKLKVNVIETLAEMNDPSVAVDLLEPCVSDKDNAEVRAAAAAALQKLSGRIPTKTEAIRLLFETAKDYYHRRQPMEGVSDDRVELWYWDANKRRCEVTSVATNDAARALAARFAREAYHLSPDNPTLRLLYLDTMLDAAAHANGLDKPLTKIDPAIVEAERFGPQVIDEVLGYAMEHGHPAAATAAATLLGQIGKADELLFTRKKLLPGRIGEIDEPQYQIEPAPLTLAIQNPDRRLRMAALKAIVRLHPTKPYPISSYVPLALGYFAASSGTKKALVGGPNLEQARTLAGMLATAGYEADTVSTGKELLLMATRSPDYELAMIDAGIEHPTIDILLQQLWRDPRTASLRVGVVARAGHFERAERAARDNPMAMAFARPHDEQTVRWQLDRLATIAPDEFVDFAMRQRQAVDAIDLLAELSRSSGKLYDLRRVQDAVLVALYNPKLSMKAVEILAGLNSVEAQRSLVETASRLTLPLELRKAAAGAFRKNTQQFGILLTTDEIRRQYRRYNESEKLDAPTQKVLGLILDCLEVPTRTSK